MNTVRAIYQYVARGSDEISLADGEMIELSSGPTGGRHYGDGWWEGKSWTSCSSRACDFANLQCQCQGSIRPARGVYFQATMYAP